MLALVICLMAMAIGVLVTAVSGFDKDVMVAAAFILAPVAVTPLLAVQARVAAATLSSPNAISKPF